MAREKSPTDHLKPYSFKPGRSGNPKGRPPVIKEVQELAKQQTGNAIDALVSIMGNERSNASARVQAAVALLDRGWGRPKQSVDVTVDHDATGLAAALAALNDRIALAAPVEEPAEIIEVTVVETVKAEK